MLFYCKPFILRRYNVYQQPPYIQPQASTSPFVMNTYGYIPPVAPVVAPVGISYQTLGSFQGIPGVMSPYTNYIRSQFSAINNQRIAIDFSVPPPRFHPQSFRERFPPPVTISEVSYNLICLSMVVQNTKNKQGN